MGIILQPFAWLLLFFYNLFNSYGIALILFAVVIKLILFPVTLKQKKSMIQTTMLSDKMQKIQKQYGKDRERYNLEIQKLYEKELLPGYDIVIVARARAIYGRYAELERCFRQLVKKLGLTVSKEEGSR